MNNKKKYQKPKRGRKIFVKCFRHYRTGKLVYPKHAEAFCFIVAA